MHARIPVLMLAILVGGCAPDDRGSQLDKATWEAELIEHRARKDETFKTSSSSPMAGTQYLKSDPAQRVWLTRDGRYFELVYEAAPEASLLVERSDGNWRWSAGEDGVVCLVEDVEMTDGSTLDGPADFVVGDSQLSFYPAEDRVTFIVFDAERSEMKAFERLLYFPPDPTYAVDARFERLADPEPVKMVTSRNLVKTFYRYAKIRFELHGADLELSAFKSKLSGEDSDGLFIPFRDATSGGETYGAGRFLSIADPEDVRFVLDFNRCYNPLCNYSPAYNCAVPPSENHLAVPIRAGEKTYTP